MLLSKEQIKQGNILFTEFLGGRATQDYPENLDKDNPMDGLCFDFASAEVNEKKFYPNNLRFHTTSSMKFHTSYDWLMKVWNKLLLLNSQDNLLINYIARIAQKIAYEPIEEVFLQLTYAVEYIKEQKIK